MLTLSIRHKNKSKRIPTPKIDILLESIGLMRHVVPRDGNSLFRCISQSVFLTQSCHTIVRRHLLQFAILQTQEFSKMTQLSINKYKKKITDTKLDGELLDMHIAAKIYKINILFYVDANPFIPLIIETPNSVKTLQVCLNDEGTYDVVFDKESVENISFVQSVIYEMLYNDVFRLINVDFAVNEMLFDKKLPPLRTNDRASLEKRATYTDMKELLEIGITPFPFKVAKALTSKLYRNTEYDIWLNNRRERFYGRWNNREFKEGSKCIVSIGNHEYHCYIQRINGKNEPVEVYVKDLAEKIFVHFDKLKLIPVEQDVREIIEGPMQVDQVFSTPFSTNYDGNRFVGQVIEQCELPIQYSNDFIQESLSQVLPGQICYPNCYSYNSLPYQQQPIFPLNSLNSTNNENMIYPWYITMPPPLFPNGFPLFKEQFVLLELPSNLNNNCIPSSNFVPPNFIDTSSKVSGLHIEPIPPSLYCNQQPSTLYSCVQCDNVEESGSVAMNYNHAYQPWLVPEFIDVPADEFQ